MHPCLLVTEILEVITEFANAHDSVTPPTPSAPAALAQTCRAFYEPASNIRWRTLHCLDPLLRCFGDDVYAPSGSGLKRLLTFKRSPRGNDWDRFLHHASRVHTLGIDPSWVNFDLGMLRDLDVCRPDSTVPLLPSLRKISWAGLKPAHFHFMMLLVPPRLSAFRVLVLGNPGLLAQTLDHLAASAPNLERLRIVPGIPASNPPVVIGSLVKVLTSLKNLVEVFIRAPICSSTLLPLAILPRLEILSARIPPHADFTTLPPSDVPYFPSLRKLTAYVDSLHDIAPLMNLVTSAAIEDISLHIENQPTASDFQDFFALVSRHNSLTKLNIMLTPIAYYKAIEIHDARFTLTPATLRPLLRFHSLSHLDLIQFHISLDDKCIADMADAWPCLERLSLGAMPRTPTTNATLAGLVPLATKCPQLTELALPVRETDSLSATCVTHPPPSNLHMFDVGGSTIESALQFGTMVAALFPKAHIDDPHAQGSRGYTISQVNAAIQAAHRASHSILPGC